MDKLNFIWKDRKRILGMPISFTKYAMNEDRLFVEKGPVSYTHLDVYKRQSMETSLIRCCKTVKKRIRRIVCNPSSRQNTAESYWNPGEGNG